MAKKDDEAQRKPTPAEEVQYLVLRGKELSGLDVQGSLDFSKAKNPFTLPANLTVWSLRANDFRWLQKLPAGLRCNILELRNTGIVSLPDDLQVRYRLDLQGCTALQSLPAGLTVGSLNVNRCTSLTALPEGLECCFLNITDCVLLREFPKHGTIRLGNLLARNCLALTALPDWLTQVAQLDVSGCVNLHRLPDGLEVSSWIDVGKSGIRSLPAGMDHVEIRWRGVPVTRRIAFEPDSIRAEEVLQEENVELRRVMLESMGTERFFLEANAEVLDTDRDTTGRERKLLRVPLKNDEDLVCVAVTCPSTERPYLIRVPPGTKSCHEAVAWTAGFDDPAKYRPTVET